MRKRNIMILIILLVTGFASVSTTLVLNGVIGIASKESDFNIIFTNAKLNNVERKDFIDNETKQTINFETEKLTTLDEEAILDYEVANTSRLYDADVVINCNIVDDQENIIERNNYILMNYKPNNMRVEAGKSKKGRITARLIKASTEDQSLKVKCTLNASAIERDVLASEYVEPFSKAGTMMVAKNSYNSQENIWQFGHYITKVIFENEIKPHETSENLIFDVSENQDKSVMAYLVDSSLTEEEKNAQFEEYIKEETGMTLEEFKKNAMEQNGMTEEEFNIEMEQIKNEVLSSYTLYIQSDTGVKANSDSSYLFYYFTKLQEIEGLECLDTSNVTNMSEMFGSCYSLTTLDVSNFDTSQVIDMSYMFWSCHNLTALDASNFDTSKVTDMTYMFAYCYNLTTLHIRNFDTKNVTEMVQMFCNCSSLTNLYIGRIDMNNNASLAFIFKEVPTTIKIHIEDNATKDWILALSDRNRPSDWNDDNFILEV